ncbi:MAG: NYN domain-containing protein [Proteobacteria bacterium]|nr:MAG: NYN domain-containing protein [Pseudomonadota bacterium]
MSNYTSMRLAVLVDADNVSPDDLDDVLIQIAGLGDAIIKRIYGDLRDNRLKNWDEKAKQFGFVEIHQTVYTKHKNATDIAMVIDAMKILFNKQVDGFCIVSSDSDFTPLVNTIKEYSIKVFGFGHSKTPDAFRKACNNFVCIDDIRKINEPTEPSTNQILPKLTEEDLKRFGEAISLCAEEDGWAHLGGVISTITRIAPDFNCLRYGYKKNSDLIKNNIQIFDIKEVHSNPNNRQHKNIFIKIKSDISLESIFSTAINKYSPDKPIAIAQLWNCLRKEQPELSYKNYGFSGLLDMLKSLDQNKFVISRKNNVSFIALKSAS